MTLVQKSKFQVSSKVSSLVLHILDFLLIIWLMIAIPNIWFHGNIPPFFMVGAVAGLVSIVILLKIGGFVRCFFGPTCIIGPYQVASWHRLSLFFILWICVLLASVALIPSLGWYGALWFSILLPTMWMIAMRHLNAQSHFPFMGRVVFNLLPLLTVITVGGTWNWAAHGPDSMVVGILTEDLNGHGQARDYALRIGENTIFAVFSFVLIVWAVQRFRYNELRRGSK